MIFEGFLYYNIFESLIYEAREKDHRKGGLWVLWCNADSDARVFCGEYRNLLEMMGSTSRRHLAGPGAMLATKPMYQYFLYDICGGGKQGGFCRYAEESRV